MHHYRVENYIQPKENTLSTSTEKEKLLMSLTENSEKNNPESIEESEQIHLSDIEDVSKNIRHQITDSDYLILADYTNGKTLEYLSSRYSVSKIYINKLLRSEAGRDFVDTLNTHKAKMATDRATALVAEGMERQAALINNMFDKGEDSRALVSLFGGLSMIEVLEKLKKLQAGGEDAAGNNNLLNFFGDISVTKPS